MESFRQSSIKLFRLVGPSSNEENLERLAGGSGDRGGGAKRDGDECDGDECDMAARITAALDYVAAHPKECEAQVFSMYSWNEFSEGGGLCPTMGQPPEYKADTRWLDEVAEALSAWSYEKN